MGNVFNILGLLGIYWYIYIFDQIHGYLWLGYLAILWLIVVLFSLIYIMHVLFYNCNGLVIFSSIFLGQYSLRHLVYLITLMESAFLVHNLLLLHIWLTITLTLITLLQSGWLRSQQDLQLKFMFSWFLFFIGGAWWLTLFLGERFWWNTTDSVEFLLLVLFIFFFYIYHVSNSYNDSYSRYIGFFIGFILCILCYNEVDPSSQFHSSFKFYIGGVVSYLLWLYFILNFLVLEVVWLYGSLRFKNLRYRYLHILGLLHFAIYWFLGVIVWWIFWFYITIIYLILVYGQVYLCTIGTYSSFALCTFFNLSFVLVITLLLLINCFNMSLITLHYIMLYMVSLSIFCINGYNMQFGYLSWIYYFFFVGVVLFQFLSSGIRRNYTINW